MQIFIFSSFVSRNVIVSAEKKHLFRVNLPTLYLSPFRIEHVLWHQQVFKSSGTIPSVFLTTVDSLVENLSVISACARIKYCIIDNPDIKTWHGPPLSGLPAVAAGSSQSVPTFPFYFSSLHLARQGKHWAWPGMSAGNLGQEGDSSEPCALLGARWIICSFARSVVLWPETAHCRLYCGRNLVSGGFSIIIWYFSVLSHSQSHY